MTPSTIGHYRVTGKLGEGGMGEVYRATDTKLGREVAIKVISASFAQDPDRLARFTREAQVLASLNHPNIAAIHGVEERALVLELVEGETLAGPLPLDTALNYAAQIADALEYAHEKGVVHRDLKPANIKVTGEGMVKVLDFGLAKALGGDARTPDPNSSPTLTMRATVAGVIMGTAGYMSPEQAKGKPVDRRADIWAFGVVLWEMLTGRPLFEGDSAAESLSQVLTKEPDLERVPPSVRRLLRSCLQKEPKQRLRSIGDWRLLLDEPAAAAPAGTSRNRRLELAILSLTGIVLAFTVWSLLRRPAAPGAGSYNLYMVPPEGASFYLDSPGGMQAISPDGRTLAFIAVADGVRRVYVRPLDASNARPLAGTELADGVFWSADSRVIGFSAGDNLRAVEVVTGAVRDVCDAGSSIRGGTWNADGTILFGSTSAPIRRIPPDGRTPVLATVLDPQRESNHLWPQFLPDGKHFLYWVRGTRPETGGVYAGALDVPPEGQIHRQIVATQSGALYAADHLLFVRGKTLFAQRFSGDKRTAAGSPVAIADNVATRSAMGQFSVSQNGVLTISSSALLSKSVTIVARDGSVVQTVGAPDAYNSLRVAPDGRSVALARANAEAGSIDIWLMDLTRGIPVRFTDAQTSSLYPVWSPDGKEILFGSNREGVRRMFRKTAAGTGTEQTVQRAELAQYPYDWSRDGTMIAYWEIVHPGQTRLLVLPLEPGGKPVPLPLPGADTISPRFSPSGKWIAFASNETGSFEVYVQAVPGQAGAAPAKVRVSHAGGLNPAWSADGTELFFNSPDDRLMSTPVKSNGARFEAGEPKALFALGGSTLFQGGEYWEPLGNGQRFVVLRSAPATERDNRIRVIVNWQAALKE